MYNVHQPLQCIHGAKYFPIAFVLTICEMCDSTLHGRWLKFNFEHWMSSHKCIKGFRFYRRYLPIWIFIIIVQSVCLASNYNSMYAEKWWLWIQFMHVNKIGILNECSLFPVHIMLKQIIVLWKIEFTRVDPSFVYVSYSVLCGACALIKFIFYF